MVGFDQYFKVGGRLPYAACYSPRRPTFRCCGVQSGRSSEPPPLAIIGEPSSMAPSSADGIEEAVSMDEVVLISVVDDLDADREALPQ